MLRAVLKYPVVKGGQKMAVQEDAGLTARRADHLDSTYTCLNNPENHQKTSRMESPEQAQTRGPQKRVGRAERRCVLHGLAGGSRGGGAAYRPSRAPESGLQKRKGQKECVPTASAT